MSQKNRTLAPPVAPEESKPKGKFRKSGHLTDQQLKYDYPKGSDPQQDLFSQLLPETLNRIDSYKVDRAEIVEGIKLSPSEQKVIDCLSKILHEKSQNLDPKKPGYYTGNQPSEIIKYGSENVLAPRLAFTLYELTKEYKGGDYVSGKDIENVRHVLHDLDNRRFLYSYIETTKTKTNGRIERKIEDFKKLIHIVKMSETEYSQEDVEIRRYEETIIMLNPIFSRQIDSKFILYPNDIHKRTMIAYGSWNISDIALRLREYLVREISSKRYKPEVYLDRLYYIVAEKWMKESRKGKVKEYLQKAIETCEALGIIESYETKTGATGAPLMVFTLNKSWE
jgi:hypothetical protein